MSDSGRSEVRSAYGRPRQNPQHTRPRLGYRNNQFSEGLQMN